MTPRLIFFIAYVLASATSMAQDTLTLDEAIAIGMENNFQLQVAKNNKNIAEINRSLAWGEFLPNVTLNGGYNQAIRDTRQVTFSGADNKVNAAKSTNLTGDVTARWVVFEGLRKMSAYNRYLIEFDISNLDYKAEIESYLSTVQVAYFNFLVEQERLDFLKKTIELSEERLSISKSKFELGKSSKLEFLAAQVDYNTDQSALIAQKERVNSARVELNRVLARGLSTPFVVSNTILINNNLSDSLIFEDASLKNTQLLIARKQKDVSYRSLNERMSALSPNVSLFGTYSFSRATAEVGFASLNQATGPSYGLTLSWPIFSGFTNARQISTAKIQIDNARLVEEENLQQLNADIIRVYFSYKNNLELLRLEETNLQISRENAEIALERYKLGNSTALELRDAQQNALLADNRFLNAAYQVKLAEIELQRLGGNLIE